MHYRLYSIVLYRTIQYRTRYHGIKLLATKSRTYIHMNYLNYRIKYVE